MEIRLPWTRRTPARLIVEKETLSRQSSKQTEAEQHDTGEQCRLRDENAAAVHIVINKHQPWYENEACCKKSSQVVFEQDAVQIQHEPPEAPRNDIIQVVFHEFEQRGAQN